jgi:hypothetical protein
MDHFVIDHGVFEQIAKALSLRSTKNLKDFDGNTKK